MERRLRIAAPAVVILMLLNFDVVVGMLLAMLVFLGGVGGVIE